ncbi:MAG: hypothetical protein M5U34_20440 [Chloroflexi bacterium]|nr:hypothetical protein [Chloroflexota bacterium]
MEQGLLETPLFYRENGRWRLSFSNWSLPIYLLLFVDLFIGQLLTFDLGWQSAVVTLLQALIVGSLATHWRVRLLSYAATLLGLLALGQWLAWLAVPDTVWPATAGAAGAGLWRGGLWLAPLAARRGGGVARGGGVGAAVCPRRLVGFPVGLAQRLHFKHRYGRSAAGCDVHGARFGRSFDLAVAYMLVRTLALLGLFYLMTAALAERRLRLSYLALLLLFAAWSLWLLLIQDARELQLYAVPAGAYLLLLGWLEWRSGSQAVARWLDWLGVLILFGSAFFGNHLGRMANCMPF